MIKRIISILATLAVLVICGETGRTARAYEFFSPTEFSDEELETLSEQYDYSNLSDEYVFEAFELRDRNMSVDGFCVTNESIYISDYGSSRILVLDQNFQKKDTIRSGSLEESTFPPRGICQDASGNLVVLTDVNNLTQLGHVCVFNSQHELIGDRAFHINILDRFDVMDDVAVTDQGNVYFTVKSDQKEMGEIYQIADSGEAEGIGNESFGYLCLTVDGEEVLFINGSYTLDESGTRLRGMPALYQISGNEITAMDRLPAIQRITLDDELSMYLVESSFGFQGLVRAGNEYFALVRMNPTLYVFGEDLEYRRTILLPLNDIVAPSASAEEKMDMTVRVVSMDANSSGDLYFIVNVFLADGSAEWWGIRATRKP